MPAGDADLLDDEAQKLLALVEVEGVEGVEGAAGEVADAVAQLVVADQFGALSGEVFALCL